MFLTPEIKTLFKSNDLDEIGYLLRNGLNVNSLDSYGHNAIFYPDCGLEKTKFLLKQGIDLKFTSEDGLNALFSYVDASQPFDKFKFLIENGLNYKQIAKYEVSDCVFNHCSIEIAEYLFKHLNFDICRINDGGYNLLNSSRRDVCEFLVKKELNIFNLSKNNYNTLFCNSKDTMEYLVNLGVDPFHISNVTGDNLLFYSDLESIKYLCNLGLSALHENRKNETCIMVAGYKEVKYLVEEQQADIHAVDKNGRNILFRNNKDIDIIKFALNHNVDIFSPYEEDAHAGYHLANMPTSFIPEICKNGLLKYEDFYKIIFTPKAKSSFFFHEPKYNMDALYQYIEQYINNGGDINILNPDNNYNLLMTYGEKSEKIANFLIENGIDLYYHVRQLSVLDRCKFSSTYQLLKDKNFFTDTRFNVIREIFDFSSLEYIEIRNKDIHNDLFKQNFKFNSADILSCRYPRYKIKEFLKAGLEINQYHDYSKALYDRCEQKDHRQLLSLLYHGVSPNYIYCKNSDNNEENYSIFDCLSYFPTTLKKYTVFMFKYLIKNGLSLQKMQQSEYWNKDKITLALYNVLQSCPEKIEILEMIKKEIDFLSFAVLKSDKDIIKYLLLNFDVYSFCAENQKQLLIAGLQYMEDDDSIETSLKYSKQVDLLMDSVKKELNIHILSLEKPLIHKKETAHRHFKKPIEINDSIFLNNEYLLNENIIHEDNMHKLTVKNENCLFYINDFELLSSLLDRGVNTKQISIEGYNSFTFRINKFIHNKKEKIEPHEMNILSLLLSKNIDPYQPSRYPYCIMKQLSEYNKDMYDEIRIIIDKHNLLKISSDAGVLVRTRL